MDFLILGGLLLGAGLVVLAIVVYVKREVAKEVSPEVEDTSVPVFSIEKEEVQKKKSSKASAKKSSKKSPTKKAKKKK